MSVSASNQFRSFVNEVDRIVVEKHAMETIKPGSVYCTSTGGGHFLDYRTMHRVRKPKGLKTTTLMLSGFPCSDYSLVAEGEEFKPGGRNFMSPQDIMASLGI